MKRLNKTLNDYSSRLEAFGFNKETDKITLLTKLRDCDVSKGKYTRFLLECYLDKTIRDEDLSGALESTVGKTISLFHKNKNKLPEEDRSLNRYKTVGELWKNVRQFEKEKSAHELKKEHRDKINKETKFIVDKDYKILSPLTEESAKFWGRGTRWCTSAKENNAFNRYNEEASLYIVIFPNGRKFQLWRYNYDFEIMDEADDGIDAKIIEENWNYFKELYDILPLYYIPQEKITYEKCLKEVKSYGWSLRFVPEELKNYVLCLEAVKDSGDILKIVPESLKDYNLCLEAVKDNGGALEYVPESLKDYNLCLQAIKNNGWALKYTPDEFKTYDLCSEAVKKNGLALQHVPDELKTYDICLKAVKNRGWALEHTPDEFKTYELCLEAIKNNGISLKYVPEKFRIYDLCLEAVKNYGLSLEDVPRNVVDSNICLEAVKNYGESLKYVPEKLKTYELCLEAIKNDIWGVALECVPKKNITEEMFDVAINKTVIGFIKEKLIKEKEKFIKNNEK